MTKNSPIIATKFRPQLMVIPDPTVAQEFLCILDSTAAEFTFQSFDDDKNRKDLTLAQICHGSFEECCDWACSMSARGAGVFVAINRTDFKGRKAKNIIAVRYYIADLDGVPLENLQRLGIRPNILVQTSDEKFHCYWRITGAPLETYSEIETRLNNLLAADSSVKDLPRVLRVPGFPHQKDRSNPFMVRMIDHDALSFTSVEFEAALRAAETLALSPRATGNRSSASERTKEPKGLSMPEWKLGSPPD